MGDEYFAGMMKHTIVKNMSAALMPEIDTGNALTNMMLSFFVMSTVSYIVSTLNKYIYILNIFKFLKKININRLLCIFSKKVSLEFSAKCSGEFYEYSEPYLSILHYINTCDDISKIIISKEELRKKPRWFSRFFDEDDEDENNNNSSTFFKKNIAYRITQKKPIKLNEHVYCAFYDKNIEKSQKNEKDQFQTVNIECLNIELYSYTKDICYLQKFTDALYSEYIEFKNTTAFKGQMYFGYEGLTEKKRAIWKEMEWHTNKCYDNIFIENKQGIIDKIKRLTNMHDFNVRMGRPDKFCCLLWGEDYGCGKTSLIKAICNTEFHDRHVVNVNLSKIKTCAELENIISGPYINGRKLKTSQCIFIIDEIDKCCPCLLKENNRGNNSKEDYSKLMEKYKDKLGTLDDSEDKELSNFFKEIKKSSCDFKEKDALNSGFMLNVFDGPIEYPGLRVLFAGNRKDVLIDGFIRPGRMDLILHIKKATVKTIIQMLECAFSNKLNNNNIKFLNSEINDYDIEPSFIQEACIVFYQKYKDNDKCQNEAIKYIIAKKNDTSNN
tara:strand:- start:2165 stop:3823 length:1659 start_codon:yes stop_codon:yes gene_type:complete